MKKLFIIIIIIVCASMQIFAQNNYPYIDSSELGLQGGGNVGVLFANKYPAQYYNGSEINENPISFILDNTYHRQEIEDAINTPDTTSFNLTSLPENMTYKVAINLGFFLKSNFRWDKGVFISFNYTKLETIDVFTLEIPPSIGTFYTPLLCNIYGSEERINIDLGYTQQFKLKNSDYIRFYFDIGANINNTKVQENLINIEGDIATLEYSLVNIYGSQQYIPNTQLSEYTIMQGGIGFGMFASVGLKLLVGDHLSIDPHLRMYYQNINLTPYQSFKPSFVVGVNLTYKNIQL